MNYEITFDTQLLLPIDKNNTKIIETDNEYLINDSSLKVLEHSCEYFGSSYSGRKEGTRNLTGITHKSPIIIEESNKLIYFPTESPRLNTCSWIGFNNIKEYFNNNGKATIIFDNNRVLDLNISYGVLDNQMLRSSKLESILRKRLDTTS